MEDNKRKQMAYSRSWDAGINQAKLSVTKPNKIAKIGIKKLINRAIWAQGLRKKLEGRGKATAISSNSLRILQ